MIEILRQDKDNISNATIQKKLTETYFPSSTATSAAKKEACASGAGDKAQIHAPKAKDRKIFVLAVLSMSILLSAAGIFFVFSTHALNINIIVNKKGGSSYENLILTQKVGFLGAAVEMGHLTSEYLLLIDDGAQRDTGVTIDLKEPMDLSNRYLLLSLMAKRGGGTLKVILRDKNYRSYTSEIIHVQDGKREWQNFIVSAYNPKESIDVRKIRHIRLEFETNLKEPGMASEIHIKKLVLIDG